MLALLLALLLKKPNEPCIRRKTTINDCDFSFSLNFGLKIFDKAISYGKSVDRLVYLINMVNVGISQPIASSATHSTSMRSNLNAYLSYTVTCSG